MIAIVARRRAVDMSSLARVKALLRAVAGAKLIDQLLAGLSQAGQGDRTRLCQRDEGLCSGRALVVDRRKADPAKLADRSVPLKELP